MSRQPPLPVDLSNHAINRADGPEAIYSEVYPALLRLAVFLVGDRPSAEDLCQDTFVSCMSRLQGMHNPNAYLRAAVINGSRQKFRRDSGHLAPLQRLAARPAPYQPVAIDDIIAQDNLFRLLSTLTAPQRTVVVLTYHLDMLPDAISTVTGFPVGTVKSHLSRALKTLRKESAQWH
jgi:RNA polymerase sigma factor (sigma-70 family)